MQQRNIATIVLLSLVTFGIYAIYWLVVTGRELRAQGNDVPTAWLLIVPFANYYWYYKYSQAVEKVSNAKYSTVLTFVLFLFTFYGGQVITQMAINEAVASPSGPSGNPFLNSAPAPGAQAPGTPAAPGFTPAATAGTAVGAVAPSVAPTSPDPAVVAQAPIEAAPAPAPIEPTTVAVAPEVSAPAPAPAPVQTVTQPEAQPVTEPVLVPEPQVTAPETPVQPMPPADPQYPEPNVIQPSPVTEDPNNPNSQA